MFRKINQTKSLLVLLPFIIYLILYDIYAFREDIREFKVTDKAR